MLDEGVFMHRVMQTALSSGGVKIPLHGIRAHTMGPAHRGAVVCWAWSIS